MSDVLEQGLADLDRRLGIEEPGTGEPGEATAAVETTEPVATDTAAQQEGTADPEGQPRDERGRFTRADVDSETQAKFESYLGRFGTTAEALAELPAEVQKTIWAGFEADGMVGRRSQELGEVKKTLEQIQAQTAPPPKQPQQYDHDATADYFAENPTAILPAIQQAYNSGDRSLVYLGIKALDDVDPVLAEGLRVEIAKRDALAEMSPHIERSEQAGLRATLDDAVTAVATAHPDFAQYGDSIMQQITDDPDLARGLIEGTPENAKRMLTNLYKIAAFDAARQDGSQLAQAQAEAQAQQQQEAEAAKREGFVASPTSRPGTETAEPVDPILAAFDKAAVARGYYAADDAA